MRIGQLRHRVTIQSPTSTPDSAGQELITYTGGVSVAAEVVDLSGEEFIAARQLNAEVTTRVTIRYRTGIGPSMRVLHGTRELPLVSPPIDPDGRRRWYHLMCKEVVR